jgi:hypothetical protein
MPERKRLQVEPVIGKSPSFDTNEPAVPDPEILALLQAMDPKLTGSEAIVGNYPEGIGALLPWSMSLHDWARDAMHPRVNNMPSDLARKMFGQQGDIQLPDEQAERDRQLAEQVIRQTPSLQPSSVKRRTGTR